MSLSRCPSGAHIAINFGLSDHSLHSPLGMGPQNSNPALHEPLAGCESPICHNVNSPLRLVSQVKGRQWSMSDTLFYVLIEEEKGFKLFVLGGNRTNQSVSTLGELDHFSVHERSERTFSIA